MRIGIVGAGAMGSIFAYFFNTVRINTCLLEKDRNTITNMKNGINIIINDNTERINIEIGNDPDILRNCDVIFIFVKSYDTNETIKAIAPVINESTIVVTLQNGIGNKETIARYITEEKIVYGSTSIGATKIDRNTIRLGGMGNIVIGGAEPEAVKSVEGIFKSASLDTSVTDNPDIAIWKKAIVNAGINPLGALLGIPNGGIVNNEYSRKIQENIVREAVSVASCVGIALDPDDMVEQTRSVCEKTAKNLCSMLQDINAKRRTEIDSINGIIIEHGKKNSIATPYNNMGYYLIKAKELS